MKLSKVYLGDYIISMITQGYEAKAALILLDIIDRSDKDGILAMVWVR